MTTIFNDPSFVLSFSTLLLASVAALVNKCYKSKCSEFNMCYNCLIIKRDIIAEQKIDLEKKINNSDIEIQNIK
jgi:hypothetical protein